MTIAEERELYERMRDWMHRTVAEPDLLVETAVGEALVQAFDHLQDGARPQAAASLALAKAKWPRAWSARG